MTGYMYDGKDLTEEFDARFYWETNYDVLSELYEYDKDVFKGKTILLPCDDPEWSNFTKFFAQNFDFDYF